MEVKFRELIDEFHYAGNYFFEGICLEEFINFDVS